MAKKNVKERRSNVSGKPKDSLDVNRTNGGGGVDKDPRFATTMHSLKMYNSRPLRNTKGKILKHELQSKDLPSTHIEPNRSWFVYALNRFMDKGEPKKIWARNLHVGFASKISGRRLFLELIGLGTAILYVNPVFSEPLKEAKEPDLIRYQKLNNGVKIQDIVKGEGPEAQEGDLVEFNYVCRRSNGYFVHSTVDQFSGESRPVILPLDGKEIIDGLKDVLVGMKVGGKRRALIPPNVGYVNENLKPIPDEFGPRRSLLSHAREPLIFEVQLLKVL